MTAQRKRMMHEEAEPRENTKHNSTIKARTTLDGDVLDVDSLFSFLTQSSSSDPQRTAPSRTPCSTSRTPTSRSRAMQGMVMYNPLICISPAFMVGRSMLAFLILSLAFIDAVWLGAIRRMYLFSMLFSTQAWGLKNVLAIPTYYYPIQ